MEQEINAYKISIAAACFMAVMGFTFAFFTSSSAILLDGLFSFINLFMSVLTLRVAILLNKSGNEKFHFGYMMSEPLLNTFKGLVMAGVMIFAFSGSVYAMFKGGRPILIGSAILYAVITVAGCTVISIVLRNKSKKLGYPLLELEAKGWLIDTVLSSIVLVTFIAGYFISKSSINHLLNYIDPLLVIVIVIVIAPIPFRILISNSRELLLSAPPLSVQDDIVQFIKQDPQITGNKDFDIKSAKTGRFYFVSIIILIEKQNPVINIEYLDKTRESIHQGLKKKYPHLLFSIEITADPNIYSEIIDNKR